MSLIGGGEDGCCVFPYPLLFGISKEMLNAGIPGHQGALRVQHKHCVLGCTANLKQVKVMIRQPFWGLREYRAAMFIHPKRIALLRHTVDSQESNRIAAANARNKSRKSDISRSGCLLAFCSSDIKGRSTRFPDTLHTVADFFPDLQKSIKLSGLCDVAICLGRLVAHDIFGR